MISIDFLQDTRLIYDVYENQTQFLIFLIFKIKIDLNINYLFFIMDRFLVSNVKKNAEDYEDLKLSKAKVLIFPDFMSAVDGYKFYDILKELKHWEKRDIKIMGKNCKQNRFTCYFATDPDLNFRYSGT
jgi:hypothetical protein